MSKIEKLESFYKWFYDRVQNVHTITDVEFDNIIDKL